jgi:hypothetical protein
VPYFAELHRNQIVANGLLMAENFDVSLQRLREHLAQATTRVQFPLMQVWGRKPGREARSDGTPGIVAGRMEPSNPPASQGGTA